MENILKQLGVSTEEEALAIISALRSTPLVITIVVDGAGRLSFTTNQEAPQRIIENILLESMRMVVSDVGKAKDGQQ